MMDSTLERATAAGLKDAIESRDGSRLAGFYRDDAELRVVDRANPPSRPLVIRGREAIAAHWSDVCGRDMTHDVSFCVSEGSRMAYSETCAYPDGMRVFATSTLELEDGRISRETVVQAWDE